MIRWLLIPLLCISAFASDIYFAPTSAGSNNGTNCANAYAYNDGTHGWNQSAQQVAGNNLHICSGTYTITSGGQAFLSTNAGSSGNQITLVADQGAVTIQSAIFSASGAFVFGNAYWVLNGANNLTIQNTANGTGLTNNAQTTGIVISASNVTVENFILQNLCVRAAGDTGDSCTTGGNDSDGIFINGSVSNDTIQGVTASLAGHNCIFLTLGSSSSGILIQQNTLSGCNWEIGSNTSSNGVTITGNDISCTPTTTCVWDEVADNNHHNGIYFFPGSGTANNVIISNNYIHDIIGNTTAYLFYTDQNGGNVKGPIFNNIFFTTAGQTGPANGMITSGVSTNVIQVYNNTFLGPSSLGIADDTGSTNENNILVNLAADSGYCQEYFNSGQSGITAAYNDFYSAGTPHCQSSGQNWWNGTTGFSTLAAWQAGTTSQCSGGCDVTGSITGNPMLNNTTSPPYLTLGSSSAAKGAGVNLTSSATGNLSGLTTGPPQTFGVNYACGSGCVARASIGPWDLGAYPYSSSTPPSAPSPLTVMAEIFK